ncbi:MAG: hypothetical protein R3Y13_04625 [bacterium]
MIRKSDFLKNPTEYERLDYAHKCVQNSKFLEAEKIYLEIIRNSNNTNAVLRLASLYAKTTRFDKCRNLLYCYDFKDQDDIIYEKIILTKLELSEYNFTRSLILSDEILKTYAKDNPDIMFYKAIALLNLYKYDQAKQIFKKLSKGLYYNENSNLFLIKIEIILGNYNKALTMANSFVPTLETTKRNLNYIKYFLSTVLNKEFISNRENYNISIDEADSYGLLMYHINKHFDNQVTDDNLQFKDEKNRIDFIQEVEEQKKLYYPSIDKVFDYYIVDLPDTKINSDISDNNYAKIYTSLNDRILTVHPVQVSDEFDYEGYGRIRK